jgi:hypothetical protein
MTVNSNFRHFAHAALLTALPILGILAGPETVFAQSSNAPPTNASLPFALGSFMSSREAIIAFSVLAFGVLMAVLATYLLHAAKIPAGEVIRLTALLVIVTGVLFLVAAGYSSDNIAPAMGLLGTIGGYLLGRNERKDEKSGGGSE